MKRTNIFFTEEQLQQLDRLSKKHGVSKSSIIREAVDEYLSKFSAETPRHKVFEKVTGVWKDRNDLPDFEELRKEWDRADKLWGDRS